MNKALVPGGAALMVAAAAAAACGTEPTPSSDPQVTGQQGSNLAVECVETSTAIPSDGWACGESRTVECAGPAGIDVDALFVAEDAVGRPGLCTNGSAIEVSDRGPFGVGTHVIRVNEIEAGGLTTLVCTSTLTVTDTATPTASGRELELWPPNHKFERVSIEDCVDVVDACDAEIEIELLWVESNEPEAGPGNKSPDIDNLDCTGVDLRVERFGSGDGRRYTLGWRVSDDAGHVVEGTCSAVVPHDQSGRRVPTPGTAWRREVPAGDCTPPTGGHSDAGIPDTGAADTGAADTGSADAGSADAGSADAGRADGSAAPDTGSGSGSADAGVADEGWGR